MEMHEMANVKVKSQVAKYVLILNIVLPGTGTILAGLNQDKKEVLVNNIIVGLLQLVLAPFFLVGWVWSLVLALQIYFKSREYTQEVPSALYKKDEH